MENSGEINLIKNITIVYTDKFSKRNIETSSLIQDFESNGFKVSVVAGIKKNIFKKVLWKISFIFDEILKYRFLEVYNIKKQRDKHIYQHTQINKFDRLKHYLGFPFPQSKLMLKIFTRLNKLIPSLVDELSTDLIFLTSMQNYIADNFIKYAEKNRIPVVCLLSSWDHLTHGRKVIDSNQIIYYMVWNTIQENELIKLHNVNKEKIVKVGALQFDFLKMMIEDTILTRKELIAELNIPEDYRIISLMAYNERLGKNEPYVISKILNNLKDIKYNVVVLIRPFPFDSTFDIRYKNIANHKNIKIVPLSSDVNKDRKVISSMLKNSDIVLSGPGTAAIEAMYYDTPVIHIGLDENETSEIDTLYKTFFFSDHYNHIMNKNASYFCLTSNELIFAINNYLCDSSIHRIQRQQVIKEQLYILDKSSAKCIVETLSQI